MAWERPLIPPTSPPELRLQNVQGGQNGQEGWAAQGVWRLRWPPRQQTLQLPTIEPLLRLDHIRLQMQLQLQDQH